MSSGFRSGGHNVPVRKVIGDEVVYHDPDFAPIICQAESIGDLFDHGRAVSAGGRGGARIVSLDDYSFVVRKYLRGGLPGRLIKKSFLYLGEQQVRGVKEFRLLARMRDQGLPVPRPIATGFTKKGTVYRCTIVLEYIPDVQPLARLIGDLRKDQWYDLGALIKRFHRCGVYHTDLNAYNILFGQSGFYVIDFDKCYLVPGVLRRYSGYWMRRNIDRLYRSLEKENEGDPGLLSNGWPQLQRGYFES